MVPSYTDLREFRRKTGRKDIVADKKKVAEGGSVSGTKAADKKVEGKKAAVPEAADVPAARTKSTKIPKLPSKNKSRLPRREKKAQQKAAQARQSGG
jgi:hypothetical protein